ncbi:signal transduction histidine kinase [Labedaea rhizosphaerae]|uniref:histidine kinase n=2 Tax=Labedaea rhizosphaerae TaxID=598644 RepID=A0A4R6RVY0_LABRH|nr:signal transduction histidine kinase [Labedaea rhizosphaerae]
MLAVLVVVLTGELVGGTGVFVRGTGPLAVVATAVVAVTSVVLLLDRRSSVVPMPLFLSLFALLLAGSAVLEVVESTEIGFIGGFVASSVAAGRGSRRMGLTLVSATVMVLAGVNLSSGHRSPTTTLLSVLATLAFFFGGLAVRQLHDRTVEAERLLEELRRTREAQAQAAAMAERQRLAREMHDVLAHSLSGLTLHLEGARMLARHDGANPRLAEAIDRAHHLAQAGLAEARQAVGMLRGADLPGIASLVRDFGPIATFAETGAPSEVDSRTQLTLYRVAQEALTNVRKHASPARVSVVLSHESDGVRLTIEDSGGRAPGEPGDGYGLTGMRERAELIGGTLTASPTEDGFKVELWVPA